MQSELHGPPENKPMEVAQPIKTWCLVEDSSLHMELTVQDPEGGNLRELPVVILPHAIAWELHNHLGHGPTTRASFALYNTPDEVRRLIDGVAHVLKVLR